MDRESFTVRRSYWLRTIQACQQRPEGVTAKKWLLDNRISDKSYYYWLHKFRKESVRQMELSAPVLPAEENTAVTFAEVPAAAFSKQDTSASAVIRIGAAEIELSENISDTMLRRILKAVNYVS